MTVELIGVSGKAGVGKDYFQKHILGTLGYKPWSLSWHFKIWAVAQGLATYEEVFITKPERVRTLLQDMGTKEGREKYGEDIWINAVTAWVRLMGEEWGQTRIVIPDIRFENEAELIHKMGGKVIRINAPIRHAAKNFTAAQEMHISETALDTYADFDLIIDNDPKDRPLLEQAILGFEKIGLPEFAARLAQRSLFRMGA